MRRPLLLAAALALACNSSRAPSPAPPPPGPPARPADVLAMVHLGRPNATAEALARMTESRIPVELTLAVAFGVDFSVLGAVDSSKLLSVVFTGSAAAPAYTVVFTPPSAARARSALNARYRFVSVPGLGDRLEVRAAPGEARDTARRLACALVPVPGPVSARVACATDPATLARVGRWAAFESAAQTGVGDLRATLDGERVRRDALPLLLAQLEGARQVLAAQASAARRDHARPPDYGDPEAVVALLGDLAGELARAAGDLTRLDLDADVGASSVTARAALALRADGASALARDALARAGAASTHPLAAYLPPDAALVAATRGAADARAAMLRAAVDAALRVLGDRVPDRAAARADLEALVAHAGDEAALAVARDADGHPELTVVLAQSDRGEAARDALARLARAPWLRALRVGAEPFAVSAPSRGTVLVRAAPRAGEAPSSLALGVRDGALALVTGRRALASLDALALRAGGPLPALLGPGAPEGSAVGALDLGALGPQARREGADPLPLRFAYATAREGRGVVGRARIEVPGAAVGLVRRLLGAAR